MAGHEGEKMKGRVKEGVGDITGDKGLRREGEVDKGSAEAKEQVDKAGNKIKDMVNPKR